MERSGLLNQLASDLASIVPAVDADAEHDRWKPGLGPFEEERQVEMLTDALDSNTPYSVDTEEPYPGDSQRCDIFLRHDDYEIPVEAKLLRLRYDNGNIDPNAFPKIFSPFPERTASTLLTDARKLHESAFDEDGGLLGIYYEKEDEEYDTMNAESIAEKLCLDAEYWYGLDVEVRNIARFDGLRHPVHQRGAVITWELR